MSAPKLIAVSRFTMHIKSGPQVKSRSLTTVKPGTPMRVMSRFMQNGDAWLMLETDEGVGYARQVSNGVQQVILKVDEDSENPDDPERAAQIVE